MPASVPIESSFEAAWSTLPAGHSLSSRRIEHFDRKTGIFHSPTVYSHMPLMVSDDLPDDDTVGASFGDFVRGEFGSGTRRGQCPPQPLLGPAKEISPQVVTQYLESCESELVYGGIVDRIIKEHKTNMHEQILAILSDPILGNKENARHLNIGDMGKVLAPLIESRARLQFVFPAFPFKDQNPFRTAAPPGHVDFSEVAMLVRLHVLVLALFQVHPYGADWVIISDGPAYASILGVSEQEVSAYRRRLLAFRNLLNIQGTVSIIDLKDLTQKLSSRERGNQIFDETVSHIRAALMRLIAGGSEEISRAASVLTRGMQWNVNHKCLFQDLSWEDTWALLNAEVVAECPENLKATWHEINRLSQDAALGYAAFNLALKFHNAVSRVLPDSLRGTIHPKRGQIAVPRLGDEYPWNGVPVSSSAAVSSSTLSTSSLYRLGRAGKELQPMYLDGQTAPFCYQLT